MKAKNGRKMVFWVEGKHIVRKTDTYSANVEQSSRAVFRLVMLYERIPVSNAIRAPITLVFDIVIVPNQDMRSRTVRGHFFPTLPVVVALFGPCMDVRRLVFPQKVQGGKPAFALPANEFVGAAYQLAHAIPFRRVHYPVFLF